MNGKYQTNKYYKSYLFNDMVNIKNFDSNLLKRDKKSYTPSRARHRCSLKLGPKLKYLNIDQLLLP